jgi:hypothetical protein
MHELLTATTSTGRAWLFPNELPEVVPTVPAKHKRTLKLLTSWLVGGAISYVGQDGGVQGATGGGVGSFDAFWHDGFLLVETIAIHSYPIMLE